MTNTGQVVDPQLSLVFLSDEANVLFKKKKSQVYIYFLKGALQAMEHYKTLH